MATCVGRSRSRCSASSSRSTGLASRIDAPDCRMTDSSCGRGKSARATTGRGRQARYSSANRCASAGRVKSSISAKTAHCWPARCRSPQHSGNPSRQTLRSGKPPDRDSQCERRWAPTGGGPLAVCLQVPTAALPPRLWLAETMCRDYQTSKPAVLAPDDLASRARRLAARPPAAVRSGFRLRTNCPKRPGPAPAACKCAPATARYPKTVRHALAEARAGREVRLRPSKKRSPPAKWANSA